jgi:hypothetical protein
MMLQMLLLQEEQLKLSQSSTGKAVHFGLTVLESCLEVESLSTTHGNSDLWIVDTGASCHMTCSDEGMFNCKTIHEDIKVGDGNLIKAMKKGSK